MKIAGAVLVVLSAIGVAASLGRGVFLPDLAWRLDPFRQQVLHALGRHDPYASVRAAELARVDSRYAAHPRAPGPAFVISVWAGWVTTLVAAEIWIRHTRSRHLAI